ncbi:MAG: alanine racemase [Ruminiclostridium sp.]|nr:alanine racemase [Ruminiclostridium sp.]
MDKLLRRVWAEIDLDNLDHNIELIKQAAGGIPIMAVVKADAYGHSADIIAAELWEKGIKSYAVSNVLEAIDLRKTLGTAQIVIFGYCDPEWQQEIIDGGFEQTAASLSHAKMLSGIAVERGISLKVHVKVNTGMNRVGIDTAEELHEILALPGLDVRGVYTHFSVADSSDPDDVRYTQSQQAKLDAVSKEARESGIPVYSRNSGGILYHPQFGGDMVRSGIITYGCMPNTALPVPIDIKPVMRLRAAVCQIKTVPAGSAVSYGRTYVTDRETTLAVVPVGYADGYSRGLSGKGAVYINGKRAPITGRVCMDQMMVDVTGLDVKVGDIAELYSDTIDEIKADNIAETLGTIGYELLCLVSKRVPRAAVRGGEILRVVNYI